MKFCKHCGKQLDEDAKFCSGCGTSSENIDELTTENSVQLPIETEKTKEKIGEKTEIEVPITAKKRKAGVVWSVVAAAVIIGVVLASVTIYNWYNNDEQKIIRALNAGEYEEALEIVKTDEALKDSETLADKLVKRIGVVEKEYCDEKIAYADAVLELNTIQKMGMPDVLDEILETKNHLSLINQSRMCFSSAETFFKDANYVEAMRLYAQVIEEDSNYEKAKKQYSEAVNKYREQMLTKAAEYVQQSDYTSAVEILDSALSNLPDDGAITEQRLVYAKAKKEAFKTNLLEEAAIHASEGGYLQAIGILDYYYKAFNEEDIDINLQRQEYCNKFAASELSEAQKEVDNDEYWLAIERINSALSVTGSNELLTNKLNEYKNMYVDYVLKKSAAYIEDKDYDRALIAVNVALEDLPGNERLLAEQKKINDLIPKNLMDVCDAYETANYSQYKSGKTFKMSGNSWTNGFTLSYTGYAYFNLNGNYNVLEFDCGHVDGSSMVGKTVTIYLDGVAYKTMELSADGLPQHINIEVRGARQLKFQLAGESSSSKYGFANVTVQ